MEGIGRAVVAGGLGGFREKMLPNGSAVRVVVGVVDGVTEDGAEGGRSQPGFQVWDGQEQSTESVQVHDNVTS